MTLVTDKNVNSVVFQIEEVPVGAPIAVDCETTGLHPYQGDTLRGFSFAFRDSQGDVQSFYVPVGYPEGNLYTSSLHLICAAIRDRDPVYVYHHAKFDLRFLRQLPRTSDGGVYFPVPTTGKLWDTKIVAWLLDENWSSSLDVQAALYLGEAKSTYMTELRWERGKAALKAEGVKRPKKQESLDRGWREITAEDTAEYGAKDAELTLRLAEVQHDVLSGSPLVYGNPAPAVEREFALQRLLLRMEDRGICVDLGDVEKNLAKAQERKEQIERTMLEWYGVKNLGSTKQVAKLLYDDLGLDPGTYQEADDQGHGHGRTRTIVRSTNAATLEKLRGNEIVRDILEHRKLAKMISAYLVPMERFTDDTGRIHPTFWQHGTVTGRFSCTDPNLQTIPRRDKLEGVRDLFTASPGYELWEYDLKAAEMRVMADLSQDPALLALIASDGKPHDILAEKVWGPKYTGLQRRYAKNIGYGFNYGLTNPATAAKYIENGDTELAKRILKGLKELYPAVVKAQGRETLKADKLGYVAINEQQWPGRFRRFITESPNTWPKTFTALNAKIQGGIAEMIKDVMLESEQVLDYLGARLLLQVHDSLVIEVPPGAGYEVQCRLQDVLDKVSPYGVRQEFDAHPWGSHD